MCKSSLFADALPPPLPGKTSWPWTAESRRLPDAMPDGAPWPRISIVTPSYNQAAFLEETIRSVLLQGYPNLEYIVIDGGSTDGSMDIIRKYETWIDHWVSKSDRGQSHALNKGLERSTGAIMGWQNSDDIYLPGAFFHAAEGFRKDPGAALVFGNMRFIDSESLPCGELRFVPFSRWSMAREGMLMANQAAFWRRELYEAAGPMDETVSFCMDYEFFLRASAHGRFRFTRRQMGAFRLHEDAKSSTIARVGRKEQKEVLRRLGFSANEGLRFWLEKRLSLLRRAFLYAYQGDMDYLLRGGLGRLRATFVRGQAG